MEAHKAARMRRNGVSNLANTGFAGAMQAMVLVGVIYCARGILTGSLSYGTLTAIMQLIAQVQGPLAGITGYLPQFYAVLASAAVFPYASIISEICSLLSSRICMPSALTLGLTPY